MPGCHYGTYEDVLKIQVSKFDKTFKELYGIYGDVLKIQASESGKTFKELLEEIFAIEKDIFAVEGISKIRKFDLTNCQIGDEEIKTLVEYLKKSKITSLDLSGNNIGDEGVKTLEEKGGFLRTLHRLI